MKVNLLLMSAALISSSVAIAHDGGHGPKMTETGKYGGSLSDVTSGSNSVYKSELVQTSGGKVQLFVYEKSGKPVDLSSLSKVAKASMTSGRKGSEKSKGFEITNDGKSFSGTIPEPTGRPYNLTFTFSEKGKDLATSFTNLE